TNGCWTSKAPRSPASPSRSATRAPPPHRCARHAARSPKPHFAGTMREKRGLTKRGAPRRSETAVLRDDARKVRSRGNARGRGAAKPHFRGTMREKCGFGGGAGAGGAKRGRALATPAAVRAAKEEWTGASCRDAG